LTALATFCRQGIDVALFATVRTIRAIACILVILGAINWGLVGLVQIDGVAAFTAIPAAPTFWVEWGVVRGQIAAPNPVTGRWFITLLARLISVYRETSCRRQRKPIVASRIRLKNQPISFTWICKVKRNMMKMYAQRWSGWQSSGPSQSS
jgi:hypothetical protein